MVRRRCALDRRLGKLGFKLLCTKEHDDEETNASAMKLGRAKLDVDITTALIARIASAMLAQTRATFESAVGAKPSTTADLPWWSL